MSNNRYAASLGLVMLCMSLAAPASTRARDLNAMLGAFADDYVADPMLRDTHFGIAVGDRWWSVRARKGGSDEQPSVVFTPGKPSEPTWYYRFENEAIVEQLFDGTFNAATMMVKEFSSDKKPMDVGFMDGFKVEGMHPGGALYEEFLKVSFHFWYRGFPELVPFGPAYTRLAHGVDAVMFYYQPGLRSGYFHIRQGQHANENPASQKSPFPKLFIFTAGQGKARVGDTVVEVEAGWRLFVPPQTRNEFWNDNEQPLEGVLIMFGEGA